MLRRPPRGAHSKTFTRHLFSHNTCQKGPQKLQGLQLSEWFPRSISNALSIRLASFSCNMPVDTFREKRTDKQRSHKGIRRSACLRSVPGKVWGRVPGHPGRPDLIYVQFHIDWTECLRDKRDISTGQTGHVHEMVAVQKWGCPAEFLYVTGVFCYTGVDQITTKGAGGSTHCQDNMLPRRECFLRIERALHRFCHKPSEGLARSMVLSHHSRAKVLRSLLKA